jgi:hypothetical protein
MEKLEIPPLGDRRFKETLEQFPQCYSIVTLPANYEKGRRYPVLFDYPGNYWPPTASTGLVEDVSFGYGLIGEKEVLWVVLPFVGSGGNQKMWWGDPDGTALYAEMMTARVCESYGGDLERLFLCGFSRGAIAVNYIGLRNDSIARLWKGLISFDHYDGDIEWKDWSGPLKKYRREAAERLKRGRNKHILIMQEPNADNIREYFKEIGYDGNAEIWDIPMNSLFTIPNDYFPDPHTDKWLLFDNDYTLKARTWFYEKSGLR